MEVGAHNRDLLAPVSEIGFDPTALTVERVSAGSHSNFLHRKLAQDGHARSAKSLGRGVRHRETLKG
jgi:hypothetical protein